jgi:hypothetical protein
MPYGRAFPHELRRGKSSGLQRFRQVSILYFILVFFFFSDNPVINNIIDKDFRGMGFDVLCSKTVPAQDNRNLPN